MADFTERRVQRSPNYPLQPLDWAVETGMQLLEKEGLHPVSPDVIAMNLGYKDASNGRAKRILANLKAFGILHKTSESRLAVSPDVRRFKLTPNERDKAIFVKQWLKKPLLYSKLLDKYGDNLPSDRALVFELVDEYGFIEASAQAAIDVFRASLRYVEQVAGVFDDDQEGQNQDHLESNEEIDANSVSSNDVAQSTNLPNVPRSSPVAQLQAPFTPSGVRYPIRLAGGRMAWIEVPDPFYEADKNRLRAQLEIIGTVDEDAEFVERKT